MNKTTEAINTPLGLIPKETYDLIVDTNASLCSLAYCEYLTKKQRKAISKALVELSKINEAEDEEDPFV